MRNTFLADVHLGRLARLLRLLGFDTLYRKDFTKPVMVATSSEEDRILLSRDARFAKHGPPKYFIVSGQDVMQQLQQVVMQFDLKEQLLPFSRCIACNGILESVSKESIGALLEKNTKEYYNEFWQCDSCKRIYWKGSHYNRMLNILQYVRTL